jgi:hypothetical protein
MGNCKLKKSKKKNKTEEKKFTYEDKNVKIEKKYSKETNGETINERCEKNIFVKNPKINYLEAQSMYPRLAGEEED